MTSKVRIPPLRLLEENNESLIKGKNIVLEDKIEMILRQAFSEDIPTPKKENNEDISDTTPGYNTVLSGDELRKSNYGDREIQNIKPHGKEIILDVEKPKKEKTKKFPQKQNTLVESQVLINKNSRLNKRKATDVVNTPKDNNSEGGRKLFSQRLSHQSSKEKNLDIQDVKGKVIFEIF